MPRVSSPSETNDNNAEQFVLTDKNVAILYQIITAAQHFPEVEDHPFRAIFSAYDTILSQHGLDPHHDQIYLRFLFRLGDRREEGRSLYEIFEELLDELGIQIEFNTDEDEVQQAINKPYDDRYKIGHNDKTDSVAIRSRRASFHSVYDAEDEDTSGIRSRRSSLAQLPLPSSQRVQTKNSAKGSTRSIARTRSDIITPRSMPAPYRGSRLTGSESSIDVRGSTIQRLNRLSEKRQDLSAHRSCKPTSHPQSDDANDARAISPLAASDILSHFPMPIAKGNPPYVPVGENRNHAPSRTQLFRDADTFHSYRVEALARDALEKWSYAAIESKEQHERMLGAAISHDAGILRRQAFEHWRFTFHEKRQLAETELYFGRLEKRATKARDLMLLSKAFTHWSQCAEDEHSRTSLARQRLLATKYFSAWKDITMINQDRITLQNQRRYFELWKQRYVQQITLDIKADLVYERTLQKSFYWEWFWAFCERRAPDWQARRLKHRFLSRWLLALRTSRQRHQHVSLHVETAALKYFAIQWRDKAIRALSNLQIATMYHRRTSLAHAVRAWTRAHSLSNANQLVSNMVDWRVAGITFVALINQSRLTRQADSLDRLRLTRNAWTQWNDHLRWQTLTRRIDDRHLLEALYRWTIAYRLHLLKRLTKSRLKNRFLHQFYESMKTRRIVQSECLVNFKDHAVRQSIMSILSYWRLRCQSNQQAARLAFDFHSPKVSYEALQSLSIRSKGIQAMTKMASDTAFYFICKRCIKRWQTALFESKRQRRRNAYLQIRRKSKINLASEMLRRCRSSMASSRLMDSQATAFQQDRSIRLATEFFDHWTAIYESNVRRQSQAIEHYNTELVRRMLRLCMDRCHETIHLDDVATANATMRIQSLAFQSLNKIRLRIIELKGPQATAMNLQIRYGKRHSYSIFRVWQEKTARRLEPAITPPRHPSSSQIRRARLAGQTDDHLDVSARVEGWTGLDQVGWTPTSGLRPRQTPLPGYLSTPSKRAARAKILARESTTPSGTPFQSALRTTRRTLFGRSSTLRSYEVEANAEGSGSTTVVDRDE